MPRATLQLNEVGIAGRQISYFGPSDLLGFIFFIRFRKGWEDFQRNIKVSCCNPKDSGTRELLGKRFAIDNL